jgi:subtilisin family serine protease
MSALRSRSGLIAALTAAAMATPAAAPAAGQEPAPAGAERFVRGELIVRFDPDVSRGESRDLAGDLDARVVDRLEIAPSVALVELPAGLGVKRGDLLFEGVDGVRGAEPNGLRTVALEPDDDLYGQQWGLSNSGGPPFNGVIDADIDAPGAWGLAVGDPDVTVAVIDTGTAISHPDLSGNLWTNPLETLDGLDNDGNQITDDVNGADLVEGDGTPDDANTHGSHVTGTLGASGNNATGITGVSWNVGLMPLKAGTADGGLTQFAILAAIDYAATNGARIVNASFTGTDFSAAERDAIAAAPDVLFVAAAGNQGTDNDSSPRYPCNYDLPNIVCVAATNQFDALSTFASGGSNFGKASVDLAAPGSSGLSTIPAFAPPLFSDNFEAGLGDWTVGGTPGTWAASAEQPHTGNLGLSDSPGGSYPVNADNTIRLADPLDLSAEDACRMQFNASYSLAPGDTLWVQGSEDPNSGWTGLAMFTGTQSTFGQETVDLLGFSGDAVVYLRFRLVSNGSVNADGAHIDDVKIECEDPLGGGYGFKSGTSMATPHVAGTAALLLDRYPAYTPADLRAALLGNVDRLASLHCKVATGGRLNAFGALDVGVPASPPAPDCPAVTTPTPPATVATQPQPKPNKCKKIKDRRKRKKCNRKRLKAAASGAARQRRD